jgi:predicted nucleic acid-binding protein
MILFDTDVAVDILRGYPPALTWLQGLGSTPLGLPGLVVMELLQGCRNKTEQQRVERFYQSYPHYWPTDTDCQRALQDFAAFHLSNRLAYSTLSSRTPQLDRTKHWPHSMSSTTASSPV